ncbi:MAG: hypothetical protein ABSE59_01630 [Opitutaceae bacterium]|jgi:hypothetical protein
MHLPASNGASDEEIARLCRQVCLCRTRGETAEASRFEIMLRAKLSTGFDEAVLQEIFSAEQRRVIDALMLAELLGPLLAEKLTFASSNGPPVRVVSVIDETPATDKKARSTEIADLIEGMLVQERIARGHAA